VKKLVLVGVLGALAYVVGRQAFRVGRESAAGLRNTDTLRPPNVLECWGVFGPFAGKQADGANLRSCVQAAARGEAFEFPASVFGASVEIAPGEDGMWDPPAP
jgi:hypothetical protein